MNIKLVKELRAPAVDISVQKGTTIEELYRQFEDSLPYTVLAAKINNKIESLEYKIESECRIEFLDMRTQAASLIYQNSLILLYLKAVEDVLGKSDVDIENAINKGLYTEIKTSKPVTSKEVKAIEHRMKELVNEDLPFLKENLTKKEATDRFMDMGCPEKTILLNEDPEIRKIPFYSLGGYKDFFYGQMVPSTGYIKHFELRKYRRGVLLRFPQISSPDRIPEYVDEKMLYKTFGEQSRWGKLMGITYVSDLNRKIEEGKFNELIQLSEALHERRVVEIADMITKQNKRIVLIAGPSSSGKTTFARRLCIQLRVNGLEPLYMSTDDYFVERSDTPLDEYGEKNFEDIEAIDVDLFNRNMNDLLAGKTVDLPTFDFIKGTKIYGKRITSIKGNQLLVIEGIHALNEALTFEIPKEEKFKIYISPLTQLNIDSHNRIVTTDHRMLRRMVRDYKYRGYSAQNTIASWPKVRAGEDKNIFPFSNEADVLFNSVHLYEICVLKKYAQPLLSSIKPEEPEYSDAVRMLNFLRFFRTVEDDSAIVNNSILREFIGGSVFVD
ncbi:MAG: nucleoside kinase [Clostridiales bacterium]|nr:nucleoside kinase [Bacillota bacterium]MEE0517447.1 hypothetical protein [Anaerovoracaceae bacterium]PWL94087.1 MAG: nucleoside kinase [Clostridiales bacterium]